MTMKETLKAKSAELVELKAKVEEGDEEALASAETLTAEIETLENQIKTAEAALAKMAAIGTEKKENEKMSEFVIESESLASLKGMRGSVAGNIKAAAPVLGTQIGTTDRNVVDAVPALNVRNIFGAEYIDGNALNFFVMGTTEGAPAVTAEGAAKTFIQPKYEKKTVALKKVAAYLKESDELLSDAAFLDSAVRNRGVYEVDLAIEGELVSELVGTAGLQTLTGLNLDNILKAKTNIIESTGYTPDSIIINPTDLQTILTTKDTSGQYLFGGPAYAPYGNGAYANGYPPIWGMTVVTSNKIAAGTAIVGAARIGASVVGKNNEGRRVEVSNSNEDDFIKNMVTVRIEERLVLAVRVPGAFCKISAT